MNPKVLGGLAAIAIAFAVLAPGGIGAASPALMMLACPISMLLMMRGLGSRSSSTVSPPSTGEGGTAGVEVVTLRAEVDQLRAELRDLRDAPSADPA